MRDSPVCIRICCCRCDSCLKDLSQYAQSCLRIPECTRLCWLSCCLLRNAFRHTVHRWFLSGVPTDDVACMCCSDGCCCCCSDGVDVDIGSGGGSAGSAIWSWMCVSDTDMASSLEEDINQYVRNSLKLMKYGSLSCHREHSRSSIAIAIATALPGDSFAR